MKNVTFDFTPYGLRRHSIVTNSLCCSPTLSQVLLPDAVDRFWQVQALAPSLSQGKPYRQWPSFDVVETMISFIFSSFVLVSSSNALNEREKCELLAVGGREIKRLVKKNGVPPPFRESRRAAVFNPWLCGSPGMPSLLLLPRRQGIKETLHLCASLAFAKDRFLAKTIRRIFAFVFAISQLKSLHGYFNVYLPV